jgi:hypothetical protein
MSPMPKSEGRIPEGRKKAETPNSDKLAQGSEWLLLP